MKIVVNDEAETIDVPLSISGLLEVKGVESPDMVSVQLNGEFVDRKDYATVLLKEADEVDFVYFMGGGTE